MFYNLGAKKVQSLYDGHLLLNRKADLATVYVATRSVGQIIIIIIKKKIDKNIFPVKTRLSDIYHIY